MAQFFWVPGEPLDSPFSWTPQPDPHNPRVPDAGDQALIYGSGDLIGSLTCSTALLNGTLDLKGSIAAYVTLQGGVLTIEKTATLDGAALTITGGQLIQKAGDIDTSGLGVDNGLYTMHGGTLGATNEAIGINAAGSMNQTGGINATHSIDLAEGSYTLSGNAILQVGGGNEFIGEGKTATFTQKSGTHTLGGSIVIGDLKGGDGTYELKLGTFDNQAEYIGRDAVGQFLQTGGTSTVSDRIVLGINYAGAAKGDGTYTLGGTGKLSVKTIFDGSDIGEEGHFNFNVKGSDSATLTILGTGGFPGLIVGGEGKGTFTHGHGDLSTTLDVGFRLSGDGTYDLRKGNLTSTSEIIGDAGTGHFLQGGGNNSTHSMTLGAQQTGAGDYQISKGSLSIYEDFIVGKNGNGHLIQTGGDVYVAASDSSRLFVGGKTAADTTANGTYTLTDGHLNAESEVIGIGGTGVFTQAAGKNNPTDLTIYAGGS